MSDYDMTARKVTAVDCLHSVSDSAELVEEWADPTPKSARRSSLHRLPSGHRSPSTGRLALIKSRSRKVVRHVPFPSSAAEGVPEDCSRLLPHMSTARGRNGGLNLLPLLLFLALCRQLVSTLLFTLSLSLPPLCFFSHSDLCAQVVCDGYLSRKLWRVM